MNSNMFYQKDGVLRLWPKVVNDLKVTPDEGVCLEVLHTAGRHGLPELATDALHHLQAIEVSLPATLLERSRSCQR